MPCASNTCWPHGPGSAHTTLSSYISMWFPQEASAALRVWAPHASSLPITDLPRSTQLAHLNKTASPMGSSFIKEMREGKAWACSHRQMHVQGEWLSWLRWHSNRRTESWTPSSQWQDLQLCKGPSPHQHRWSQMGCCALNPLTHKPERGS